MTTTQVENFSLGSTSGTERGELFEQQLSASHTEMTVRLNPSAPPDAFSSRIRRTGIDDLALVDATCGLCEGVRSRQTIRRSDADHLVILVNKGGREMVSQDGRTAVLSTGDAVVWDTGRPASFEVLKPVAKRSLFIPRQALEHIGGPAEPANTVLRTGDPAMSLLTSYLDVLSGTAEKLGVTALQAARDATLSLVRAVLQPGTDAGSGGAAGADTALLHSMFRTIDARISDGRLGPRVLAATHHVSVRTVHRLFHGTGDTVAGVIRKKRLTRARQNLMTGTETISTIAQRWCFSDASHFSRAFRKHYGMSPREFRENRPSVTVALTATTMSRA